jgi:transcriptional regulator with XRE-family HTH domain
MTSTPLGHFLQSQLDARNELAADFAARAGLGVSHVYQILRGERGNVRKDTLEKIAHGFGMTVPQMMATIDPTLTDDDPFLALAHARAKIQQLERVVADITRAVSQLGSRERATNPVALAIA